MTTPRAPRDGTRATPEGRRRLARLALAGALWITGAVAVAGSAAARAGDVTIHRDGCRAGVHLAARDARLSSVLSDLARTLGFTLVFESDNDPVVTIDAFLHGENLVARLAGTENFAVAHAPDPQCPAHARIVGVWVLPTTAAQRAAHAAYGPPPVAAATGADAASQQRRREQEGIDMYLRAHGAPPQEGKPSG